MPIQEPLTANELRIMWHRHPDNADVKALIWEVKRLRGIILRADQLQSQLSILGGIQGQMLESPRDVLMDEPCIAEQKRLPPGALDR